MAASANPALLSAIPTSPAGSSRSPRHHQFRTVMKVRTLPYIRFVPGFNRDNPSRLWTINDTGYILTGRRRDRRPDHVDSPSFRGKGGLPGDYHAPAPHLKRKSRRGRHLPFQHRPDVQRARPPQPTG